MIETDSSPRPAALVETGVPGLDDVMRGGFAANRMYLVEGHPGSGKTTIGVQFLMAGARRGERCMLVTLSETADELRSTAETHGWSLDGIDIVEIIASEESLDPQARYTMYHPSEVELGETMKRLYEEAARIRPTRLVFDSLSELRLLAENPLRYRRQIFALKQHFAREGCTVLFVDDRASDQREMPLHTLAHGIITLERNDVEYGSLRRRLQVSKLRGRAFREGYHDFAIRRGGLEVFPRIVAAEHRVEITPHPVSSGIEALDALLGGGLTEGTSTLLVGASGTGKSSVAAQFATTVARAGRHAAVFLFDEAPAIFIERTCNLGMDVRPMVENGTLTLRQIDPAELSPGEFAQAVRNAVEQQDAKIVVIDSLNGYLNAMPSERFLMLHLHEMLMYLGQHGVTTLLLMAQHGTAGAYSDLPVEASYVADTVIALRYFEAFGEVRQAISVVKKRTGHHQRTIRELRLDGGIGIGEPIREFLGVLSGVPRFVPNVPESKR